MGAVAIRLVAAPAAAAEGDIARLLRLENNWSHPGLLLRMGAVAARLGAAPATSAPGNRLTFLDLDDVGAGLRRDWVCHVSDVSLVIYQLTSHSSRPEHSSAQASTAGLRHL